MASFDEQLDSAYEIATTARNAERWAVSAEILAAYLKQRPEEGLGWFHYGSSLREVGLMHEAERALMRALELKSPRRWRVESGLARLYEHGGDHAEAEVWFARAMADAEAAATGWLWILRGCNHACLTDLKAAEAYHRRGIDSDDVDIEEAYENLGLVLRAQGRYAEAIAAFEQAIEFDPHDPNYPKRLRSMEGIDEAVEIAARLRSSTPLSRAQLDETREIAWRAYDEDRYAPASEILSAYLERRPEDAMAWYEYGDSLRILGLAQEAERALRRSLELIKPPLRWIVESGMAMLHAGCGHRAEAEIWFARTMAVSEAASMGHLWIMRGANHARMIDLKSAESCHRRAIECEEVDLGEAYLNLGYVLRAQGLYPEAVAAFTDGIEADPGDSRCAEALDSLNGIDWALETARELCSR